MLKMFLSVKNVIINVNSVFKILLSVLSVMMAFKNNYVKSIKLVFNATKSLSTVQIMNTMLVRYVLPV